ncbi:MAG: CBS domain-containing protein, partial [Desulfovibrio sp.]|nr:CBS domain-containing protein [Desulfovibrio sp.]
MLISNWMTKDPISVLPSTPLSKCQKLMKLRGIHRLPVVDDDNKVVGIVSDRDVKSNLPSKATTLSVHELQYLLAEVQTKEFMTPSPVTVRETETVSKAALLMLDGKFGGLPVVDDEGHLTGIITDQDVFKVFATLAGARVPGIEL